MFQTMFINLAYTNTLETMYRNLAYTLECNIHHYWHNVWKSS